VQYRWLFFQLLIPRLSLELEINQLKKTPPTSILYRSSMKPKILVDNEKANLCFNRATSWATNVVIVEQSNASIKMNFSMI